MPFHHAGGSCTITLCFYHTDRRPCNVKATKKSSPSYTTTWGDHEEEINMQSPALARERRRQPHLCGQCLDIHALHGCCCMGSGPGGSAATLRAVRARGLQAAGLAAGRRCMHAGRQHLPQPLPAWLVTAQQRRADMSTCKDQPLRCEQHACLPPCNSSPANPHLRNGSGQATPPLLLASSLPSLSSSSHCCCCCTSSASASGQ